MPESDARSVWRKVLESDARNVSVTEQGTVIFANVNSEDVLKAVSCVRLCDCEREL